MITHLAICGGGVKGCVLLGALEALENNIRLSRITHIIGSSVGGIIATLLCVGLKPNEMNDIFLKINLTDYKNICPSNLFIKYGFDNCKSIIRLLKACILQKLNIYDFTFRELYNFSKKKLILTGTDITNSKIIYYNVDTTPDMIVLDALRITISYPILYEPVKNGNSYILDGAILSQYPIDYFKNISTKVGICLKLNNEKKEINNLVSYVNALIFTIIDNIIERNINKYKKDTILIDIRDIHALEFNLKYETKINIRQVGYKTASKYIRKRVNKYYKKKLLHKCFKAIKDCSDH